MVNPVMIVVADTRQCRITTPPERDRCHPFPAAARMQRQENRVTGIATAVTRAVVNARVRHDAVEVRAGNGADARHSTSKHAPAARGLPVFRVRPDVRDTMEHDVVPRSTTRTGGNFRCASEHC